jgi:hypothetical protein
LIILRSTSDEAPHFWEEHETHKITLRVKCRLWSPLFLFWENNYERRLMRSLCVCVSLLTSSEWNVTWRLKAGTVEPEETTITRHRISKRFPATTNTQAKIDLFWTWCFLWGPSRVKYSVCGERKVGPVVCVRAHGGEGQWVSEWVSARPSHPQERGSDLSSKRGAWFQNT